MLKFQPRTVVKNSTKRSCGRNLNISSEMPKHHDLHSVTYCMCTIYTKYDIKSHDTESHDFKDIFSEFKLGYCCKIFPNGEDFK